MKKNDCTILDIRSTQMSVFRGVLSKKGELVVTGRSSCEYAGFCDGTFLDKDAITSTIAHLISNIEITTPKVKSITVGVPSEFCATVIDQVDMVYPKPIKIKPKHIIALMDKANDKDYSSEHDIISINEISYSLDNNTSVWDPVGRSVQRLSLIASFVLAEKTFIDLISNSLYEIGINDIKFVPSALCEAMTLIDEETRQKGTILIDIDDVTVSVSAILSNGLVALKTFTSGDSFISNDLSQILKIPYASAQELKNKVVLSLEPKVNDSYEVYVDSTIQSYPCDKVNSIVRSRIENIADIVLNCIESFDVDFTDDTEVFITGGGICNMIGGVEAVNKILGRKVKVLMPKQVYFAKTDYSSMLSILDYSIKNL